MVANVLPIINLLMALGNLPIAANGLPLVPTGNDMQVNVIMVTIVKILFANHCKSFTNAFIHIFWRFTIVTY